uniref:Uncharacterized protein n=2 Tax=Phasianus colchicus TaxID=9054 RepID=A0A669PR38_PHACC
MLPPFPRGYHAWGDGQPAGVGGKGRRGAAGAGSTKRLWECKEQGNDEGHVTQCKLKCRGGGKEKRSRQAEIWKSHPRRTVLKTAEQGKVKVLRTTIMVTLPLFLFFILLPCSKSQEDFLDYNLKWDYREGADKVNIGGINSITQTLEKWGNSIFWQMKHILLNNPESLLPEISSLRPVSAAVENLVREVQAIRKRLEELNERLNVINKAVLPIRVNALQSQRRGNTQLRRLPMHRRRLPARRRLQRN